MSKLVLIDSNAIMHRAYHALPSTLTTKDGQPINAVYGFVSMLLRIIADLEPTHIAACFDRKEPTFRKKVYKKYQAHRPETEKDLIVQFKKVKEVVASFGIPIYEKAGFEADDVIGTLASRAVGLQATDYRKKKRNTVDSSQLAIDSVVIVTGDKDILQLVNDKVKVYLPIKGLSQSHLMGSDEVVEKLGVTPKQIVDYKALVGDPSDNYPGVKGIGPKTAEKLLDRYGTFQNIYKKLDKIDDRTKALLIKYKKDADMSYKLAKIVTDVKVGLDWEDMDDWGVGRKQTLDLFAEFGFKSLTKRVLEISGKSIDEKPSPEKIRHTVMILVKLLGKRQYAFRGTTSLVLQGLEMNVDDIDIICDKETALLCNKLLKKYQLEEIKLKESDKFKSYFGKFVINEVLVEIMGEWQIKKSQKSKVSPSRRLSRAGGKSQKWGRKYDANSEQVTFVSVGKKKVPVTKVETELSMFSEMGRWNAYHRIKKQLESKNQQSLF